MITELGFLFYTLHTAPLMLKKTTCSGMDGFGEQQNIEHMLTGSLIRRQTMLTYS